MSVITVILWYHQEGTEKARYFLMIQVIDVNSFEVIIEKHSGNRTNNIDYNKFDVSITSKQILDIYDRIVNKGKTNE